MTFPESFKRRLLESSLNFESLAFEAFAYQAKNNPIYRCYLEVMNVEIGKVTKLNQIRFLPISFFKDFSILSGGDTYQTTFLSSGTTGQTRSKHHVKDLDFYYQISKKGFEARYGSLADYEILALLPSYLEQKRSSLVAMVEHFIQYSGAYSDFYLNDFSALHQKIEQLKSSDKKILLWGVTYALLDFAEEYPATLPETAIIMETGGMKGRKKELPREAVHQELQKAFDVPTIHSEYGMTELLSQAYAPQKGIFHTPPWMQVRLRDLNDPFSEVTTTGGVDIIDLANIDSCCFIQTQDIGRYTEDGGFEILGRYDHSDVRGCNLLVS
ncbi:MAG: acyl transferase [Bacteroidota bacterium]